MPEKRARIAVIAAAVSLCLVPVLNLAGMALIDARLKQAGRPEFGQLNAASVVFVVAVLSSTTVGALLVRRRPRHPVGWLFLILGALITGSGLADDYAAYAVLAEPGAWPGGALVAVASDGIWLLWFATVALILHLTPTGRPVSPRWGQVAKFTTICTLLAYLLKLIQTPRTLEAPYRGVHNPWALESLSPLVDPLELVLACTAGVGLVLAGVSLLVRFHRSAGVERRRLLWLSIVVIPLPLLVLVSYIAAMNDQDGVLIAATGGFVALIPIATGLSIVRYHLYDIDRILSRALTYALVSAGLVAVYAGVVLAVPALLGRTAKGSPVTTALAALLVAALATPMYRGLQRVVDQRFNRRRYETITMMRRFARGETSGRTVDDVLREALADPGLTVLYRVEERQEWVSGDASLVADASLADSPFADGESANRETIDVLRHGQPVARITFSPARTQSRLVAAAAEEVLSELDNSRLRAAILLQLVEVRQSRARIVAAQAAERHRIERNLHDGAQQRLLALAFHLRAVQLGGSGWAPELLDELDGAIAQLQEAMSELRDLANGLHPAILSDGGLSAALEDLANRIPVPLTISAAVPRLSPEVEAAAWFVACEAITNAVKHAGCDRIDVAAVRIEGTLSLTIDDDGIGGADPRGPGLRGIADRAEAAGGHLEVHDLDPSGTRVRARMPCE